MRSSDFSLDFADRWFSIGAALVALAACSGESGAERQGDGGEAGTRETDGTTDGDIDHTSIDGGECDPIPEPMAWPSWPMPNPAPSGLPHPASYSVSASGDQVTDEVTGLIW